MDYIIVKYLHIASIMGLCSCLVLEHLMVKAQMTKEELKKIIFVDAIYGISAVLILITGLLLWFAVGKPSDFYTQNSIIHIKVTIFIVIGLLSIYPTKFFLKSRKSTEETIILPKMIIMLIRTSLLLVMILPFLAIMLAQGRSF